MQWLMKYTKYPLSNGLKRVFAFVAGRWPAVQWGRQAEGTDVARTRAGCWRGLCSARHGPQGDPQTHGWAGVCSLDAESLW